MIVFPVHFCQIVLIETAFHFTPVRVVIVVRLRMPGILNTIMSVLVWLCYHYVLVWESEGTACHLWCGLLLVAPQASLRWWGCLQHRVECGECKWCRCLVWSGGIHCLRLSHNGMAVTRMSTA